MDIQKTKQYNNWFLKEHYNTDDDRGDCQREREKRTGSVIKIN